MKIVSEVMTRSAVSVDPNTSLVEAVNLLVEKDFTALPVSQGGYLVGLLTQSDLIIKGTSVHLPTFMKLFKNLKLHKKDASLIRGDFARIMQVKVGDVVGRNFISVRESDSMFVATDLFTQNYGVNPIPVIDDSGILTGYIDKYHMLRFLGEREIDANLVSDQRQIEQSMNNFLSNFYKRFMLVSKRRVRLWIVVSIFFSIVGFCVAFLIILRINSR